jgi:hypothetical protein
VSLTLFTASVDNHGGEVRLSWSYPSDQTGQLTIFKRADDSVTDSEIAAYVAGHLSNVQLSDRKIFVFRSIPTNQPGITDFAVDNNREYFYRATFIDPVAKTHDTVIDATATPMANVWVNVVDGKRLVIRAVEKVLDAARTTNGGRLPYIVNAAVSVFQDYGRRKQEECFVVVQRTAGQSVERYFDSLIAEYGDQTLRGEVDIDTLQVEWVCVGDPKRRDQLTQVFRVLRPLLRRYILRAGNGLVRDVRVTMSGDGEGQYQGEAAVRGTMVVAVVVENQMQFTREDVLFEIVGE